MVVLDQLVFFAALHGVPPRRRPARGALDWLAPLPRPRPRRAPRRGALEGQPAEDPADRGGPPRPAGPADGRAVHGPRPGQRRAPPRGVPRAPRRGPDADLLDPPDGDGRGDVRVDRDRRPRPGRRRRAAPRVKRASGRRLVHLSVEGDHRLPGWRACRARGSCGRASTGPRSSSTTGVEPEAVLAAAIAAGARVTPLRGRRAVARADLHRPRRPAGRRRRASRTGRRPAAHGDEVAASAAVGAPRSPAMSRWPDDGRATEPPRAGVPEHGSRRPARVRASWSGRGCSTSRRSSSPCLAIIVALLPIAVRARRARRARPGSRSSPTDAGARARHAGRARPASSTATGGDRRYEVVIESDEADGDRAASTTSGSTPRSSPTAGPTASSGSASTPARRSGERHDPAPRLGVFGVAVLDYAARNPVPASSADASTSSGPPAAAPAAAPYDASALRQPADRRGGVRRPDLHHDRDLRDVGRRGRRRREVEPGDGAARQRRVAAPARHRQGARDRAGRRDAVRRSCSCRRSSTLLVEDRIATAVLGPAARDRAVAPGAVAGAAPRVRRVLRRSASPCTR